MPRVPPFAEIVAEQMAVVEDLLQGLVPRRDALLGEIHRYLLQGGKRLRPALTLLAARVFKELGPEDENVYRAAAAVETIHLASLLHDDLIDRSPLRRGQPTARARWGTGPALLAGDYLVAVAYQRLCVHCRPEALRRLAAAVVSMCEAECTVLRMPRIDRRAYWAVTAGKTGALMAAACEVGGLEVRADKYATELLGSFGRDLGIAFQVVDDILDVFGSPETTGKPVGQDIATGQPNIAVIVALEADTKGALQAALEAVRRGEDSHGQAVGQALAMVRALVAQDELRLLAERYASHARERLAGLPDGPARQALVEATRHVVDRRK